MNSIMKPQLEQDSSCDSSLAQASPKNSDAPEFSFTRRVQKSVLRQCRQAT